MTEQIEERTYIPEEAPRWRWGSATEYPCPREATETSWYDRGEEPTTYAEHAVAGEISKEEDGWLEGEYHLERWLARARKRGAGSVLIGALERALEEVEEGKRDWHQRLEGAHAVANSYKSVEWRRREKPSGPGSHSPTGLRPFCYLMCEGTREKELKT